MTPAADIVLVNVVVVVVVNVVVVVVVDTYHWIWAHWDLNTVLCFHGKFSDVSS